jgi:Raf kinase inhibitor-like YbhB/YbcL family protein
MDMTITSASVHEIGAILAAYTYDGSNVSPPLAWARSPARTRSLAPIVDDSDAPDPAALRMTWVHWVLYNISSSVTGLAEAAQAADLPPGTLPGINDWNKTGYGGPCAPIGRHRCFFKLCALDVMLAGLRRATKARLEQAMKGHVIVRAELVGTYRRGR